MGVPQSGEVIPKHSTTLATLLTHRLEGHRHVGRKQVPARRHAGNPDAAGARISRARGVCTEEAHVRGEERRCPLHERRAFVHEGRRDVDKCDAAVIV